MSADTLQIKRGTTAKVAAYVPASGELVYDTTLKLVKVGDGTTAGGIGVAPIASPGLTGTPTAPTATLGDNTTKIATTAFVKAAGDLKQPLDATLTALATSNWASNSVPIGTGVDTLSQVSFAANTFPARNSSGNLVATPVTDTALAAISKVMYGTYSPTLTLTSNVTSAVIVSPFMWMRVGDVVTVGGAITIDPTTTGTLNLGVSLPVASVFTTTGQLGGVASNDTERMRIMSDSVNARALFNGVIVATITPSIYSFSFTYQVI